MANEMTSYNQNQPAPVVAQAGYALKAQTSAEVDIQIATAKNWPRDEERFAAKTMAAATRDAETARTMGYSLPARKGGGGKPIEGPSIRLAELVAANWGNLRVASRVVAIEDNEVVAVAQAMDLESNVAIQWEVRLLIIGKSGRYSDDMIRVTGAGAASRAFREAVFKIVPRANFWPIYNAALVAAAGSGGKSTEERRRKAVEHFERIGISRDKLLAALGVDREEKIGTGELATMRGWVTAIETGEITAAGLIAEAGDSKEDRTAAALEGMG